jgi:predicted DNA-binding transcriptional regulator YafY
MPRPAARVLALLELLQSGGIRTKADLATRLRVDERTVRRYVDHLIDLDVPVESVRGRYGGYRLSPGYRMPPLMLNDDEALAVLLGLLAGRRSGLLTATETAYETATAKIRRALPERLARRLDAVLGTLAFTAEPRDVAAPDGAVLLTIAAAVHAHQPVRIGYTDRHDRRSTRTLHPYGLVVHSGRWYVTGADPAVGEDRTFRLDRIADARPLPGSFEPPAAADPARQVLSGIAHAPHKHKVALRIHATADQIRSALPIGVVTPAVPSTDTTDPLTASWWQVELQVERLDWLPAVLASLDRPFVIEQPEELRTLVTALADRLLESAHHG